MNVNPWQNFTVDSLKKTITSKKDFQNKTLSNGRWVGLYIMRIHRQNIALLNKIKRKIQQKNILTVGFLFYTTFLNIEKTGISRQQ